MESGVVYGPNHAAKTAFPDISTSKRVFDVVFSLAALTFVLPFMVLVALALVITEGGPVFFRHQRMGHAGKPFGCLKFRTMAVDADRQLEELLENDPVARAEWQTTRKLTNDPRVSCLGRFLRKSSLDELPQFLNVLRGEMSVVGPRPIVADEAHFYREYLAEYKSVRPGVTGAWQVTGRSNTTFAERVRMDVAYVRRQSFWGDIKIVFQTVRVVLTGNGAR